MQNELIELIKENLVEILPDVEKNNISINDNFTDLGANSVDRGELITITLERLNLNIPRIEFAGAQTIVDLADLIIKKNIKL
jgi:polyketide biosynthesis acyl carrier protein